MSKIIRLIWRLDFDMNYQFLDKRGTALRILRDTSPGLFAQIGDGNVVNSFSAEFHDQVSNRIVSAESMSLNGSIEWNLGVDIDRIAQTDSFRGLDKTVSALIGLYELRNLRRGGVRLVGVTKRKTDTSSEPDLTTWSNDFLYQGTEMCLGKTTDIGAVFEGNSDDGLGYRANFGPLVIKNLNLAFSAASEEQKKLLVSEYAVFFDIDVFEFNFRLLGDSFFKWSSTKIEKVQKFANYIKKI